MKEFTRKAMELRVLAKAALLVDRDNETFRQLSEQYAAICGHPPFCGFHDFSYEGAVDEAAIEREWVLAARTLRSMQPK